MICLWWCCMWRGLWIDDEGGQGGVWVANGKLLFFSLPPSNILWWWCNVNEHKMWYFCRLLISFHDSSFLIFSTFLFLDEIFLIFLSFTRMLYLYASDNKYKWRIKGSYDDCSCQIFLLKDNGIEWVKVEEICRKSSRNISSIDWMSCVVRPSPFYQNFSSQSHHITPYI